MIIPERLQLLEEALDALSETLQPTPQSDELRRSVLADMQQLVAKALPPNYHCSVESFGSYRAGLHLPGSDLDFALAAWHDLSGARLEVHEWHLFEQQNLLLELANALEEQQLVTGEVERVLHARVPVIKFVHKATGLACDFSINRPECAFKAEMQRLLGSLDKRYATLYRLVKAWAAAHGVNDAAAYTLNSWSLGLMVAFYLQCGVKPAVLPPIWQLLEQQPPDKWLPRVLQQPNITSKELKRVLNQAATGAGAYLARRSRAAADADDQDDVTNRQSIGELLAGFFEFYAGALTDWAEGRSTAWRASTWWGDWQEARFGSKSYIFCIEDPFDASDNTARAVGTRNSLSSCNTAAYIAAAFDTSDRQLLQALTGSSDGGSSSSNGESSLEHDVLTAFCWLFGPPVLQMQNLPPRLMQCFKQVLSDRSLSLRQLRADLKAVEGDCMELLSHSCALINNSNCRLSVDKEGSVELVLVQYRQLLTALGRDWQQQHHVCLADFLAHRREVEQRKAQELALQRQQQQQQHQQQQQQGTLEQRQQQPAVADAVMFAMRDLNMGGRSHSAPQPLAQQQQQQPFEARSQLIMQQMWQRQQQQLERRQRDWRQQQQQPHSNSASSSSSSSNNWRSRREASAPPELLQSHAVRLLQRLPQQQQQQQQQLQQMQQQQQEPQFGLGQQLAVGAQRARQGSSGGGPDSTSQAGSSGSRSSGGRGSSSSSRVPDHVLQQRAAQAGGGSSSSRSHFAPRVLTQPQIAMPATASGSAGGASRIAATALHGLGTGGGGHNKASGAIRNGYYPQQQQQQHAEDVAG